MNKTNLPAAPAGYKWINIDEFIGTYLNLIPEELFFELIERSQNGTRNVTITTSTVDALEFKLAEKIRENDKLMNCTNLNNKGIEQEKAGDISGAISTYETNISGDCYPATHSFDRLLVLYRKAKDYESEKRVTQRALDVLAKRYPDLSGKYADRLNKIDVLICKKQ